MRQLRSKPILVLVAMLLGWAGGVAEGGQAAALITDLGGSVQVLDGSGATAARLLRRLPADTRLRVAAGGRVELVVYSDGQRARARGPLELRITTAGPVKLAGAGSLQVEPGRKRGALLDGAASLDELGGHISRPAGDFGLTTRMEPPASVTFSWETLMGPPFEVRVFTMDLQGKEAKEVWTARTDGTLMLYEGPGLSPDTTYGWEVLHREGAEEWSGRGTFRILSDGARESVRKARQEAAALAEADPASPTPHLLLAGILTEHHLLQEALEQVLTAAQLRPDDPWIRNVLESLSAKVDTAGASTGQEGRR